MKRLLAAVGCLLAVAANEAAAVEVTGQISFITKRGQRPVVQETVVWLEPLSSKPARSNPAKMQMTTRNKSLLPHVMTVPAGSTIQFPNEDPISHNLFSLAPGNSFDLGLYRKGAGKAHTFDTPGVVNVYCNVHPNMSAVIHVMPTPYYGFASPAGAFSFDVPPGRYRLELRARTRELRSQRGLEWQLTCSDNRTRLAAGATIDRQRDWTPLQLEFEVPKEDCEGQWLRLVNPAPSGVAQVLRGDVRIAEVRLESLQE